MIFFIYLIESNSVFSPTHLLHAPTVLYYFKDCTLYQFLLLIIILFFHYEIKKKILKKTLAF